MQKFGLALAVSWLLLKCDRLNVPAIRYLYQEQLIEYHEVVCVLQIVCDALTKQIDVLC